MIQSYYDLYNFENKILPLLLLKDSEYLDDVLEHFPVICSHFCKTVPDAGSFSVVPISDFDDFFDFVDTSSFDKMVCFRFPFSESFDYDRLAKFGVFVVSAGKPVYYSYVIEYGSSLDGSPCFSYKLYEFKLNESSDGCFLEKAEIPKKNKSVYSFPGSVREAKKLFSFLRLPYDRRFSGFHGNLRQDIPLWFLVLDMLVPKCD